MTTETVPYDDIDAPVVPLVKALNAFPGISTISACAGHDRPGAYRPADEWTVAFTLDPIDPDALILRPTDDALVSLEFVAWIAYDATAGGMAVELDPIAKPPWINWPGRMLQFRIGGYRNVPGGVEPETFANTVDDLRDRFFVPAGHITEEEFRD